MYIKTLHLKSIAPYMLLIIQLYTVLYNSKYDINIIKGIHKPWLYWHNKNTVQLKNAYCYVNVMLVLLYLLLYLFKEIMRIFSYGKFCM